MNVNKRTFLDGIFKTKEATVYKIPPYQRNYDWEKKQCERLMDDILRLTQNPELHHFLGNLVIMETEKNTTHIEQTIIDGQQRITTIALLLKAMQDEAKKRGTSALVDEIGTLLRNNQGSSGYSLKLKQTPDNDETYRALMSGCMKNDNPSNITTNYNYFRATVEKLDLYNLLDAINRCEIICIELDPKKDNAQQIFETLNSTGRPLTEADKIRNYLLLSDAHGLQLSTQWRELIKELFRHGQPTPSEQLLIMDDFFSTYLMCEHQIILRQEEQYETFKKHCEEKYHGNKSACIQTLSQYADRYNMITHPLKHSDLPSTIKNLLNELRKIDLTTCQPFIMKVLEDWRNQDIKLLELEKVLQIIICYLVRRSVCGVPSAGMRKFFLTLHSRIFKYNRIRLHYADSVSLFLVKQQAGTNSAFPNDADFRKAIIENGLYHKSLCRYLLFRLENIGNEHLSDEKTITIEHILPQNADSHWREIFPIDDERQSLTHLIGNLTLTGINGTLSNKPFQQKMELYRTSKATRLNEYIIQQREWSADSIRERSKRLCGELLQLFPEPNAIDHPEIIFEKVDEITPETAVKATNRKLHNAILGKTTFDDSNFAALLLSLVRHLDSKKPNLIQEIAKKQPKLIYESNTTTKTVRKINKDFYIDCSGSNETTIKKMKTILEFYGHKPEELRIYLRPLQDDGSSLTPALQSLRANFWQFFLEYAQEHKNLLPAEFILPRQSDRRTMDIRFGIPGYHISINLLYSKHIVEIMFYILDDKNLLHQTERDKPIYEAAIGETLMWHEAKKQSYILVSRNWELEKTPNRSGFVHWILNTASKLYRTFSPLVRT